MPAAHIASPLRNVHRACSYARGGYNILPLNSDKTPATRHGVKDATRDIPTIRKWFQDRPYLGIGLAVPSSILVIDLDRKPGRDGFANFKRIADCDPRDLETARATTPSGGLHLYFSAPQLYRNTASVIAPGIDTKTVGGYVGVPGCQDGRRWEIPLQGTPLLEAPPCFSGALQYQPPCPKAVFTRAPTRDASSPEFTRPIDRIRREEALQTLEETCARIIAAPRGAQDRTRYQACHFIGGLVGRGDLDELTAYRALLAAAREMRAHTTPWRDLETRVLRSLKEGIERPLPRRGSLR